MTLGRTIRSTRAAWLALAVSLVAAVVTLLVPELRAGGVVVSSVAAPLLVLVGVRLHRPRSVSWLLMALMLGLWACAHLLVEVRGSIDTTAVALVSAGQAVAAVVVLHMAGSRAARDAAPRESRLDLVVIATVLGLVGAQLVTAATSGTGMSRSALLVPTVDVAILGMLVRFMVSHQWLRPSSYLVLAAGLLAIGYDLSSALHGRRMALPGDPAQALGCLFVLLFGVAALHPSMAVAFSPETLARRRAPSTALLGLLPLVVVPVALWWVAEVTDARGLPTWVLLVAGAVVAGLCLVRAATALRASEHLAEHDPLTDLANRRGLARAFEEQGTDGGRSLLLIDVDEFKQVNDTHGHDVGDALLLQVRDRLLAAAPAPSLVARLGGDEFVVLGPTELAEGVAQRVLASLRAPVVVGELVLRTSASIGVAAAEPGTPLAELLTRADVAMYVAKASGRDTVVGFHPRMRAEVAHRFTLTGEVRQLLGGRSPDVGRLEVHYQPLVELRSGEVVGAEALVRWRHPRHGLLAPGAFLDVVSSNGLDVHLDAAVLHDVLAQLARWRDQGRRALPVSVNLTRDSLADPRLAARVVAALADAGVPATQLHVEITEHQELPDDSPAARSLEELRAAGVATHLDDYGTGYTSLDYLRRFPVEVLKLDRSVVTSAGTGSPQLVAGIAAMAAALELELLAEGVETPEQRGQLVDLGVRYGQGYLFSPPLPAADYAEQVLGPARAHEEPPAGPVAQARRRSRATSVAQ